MLYTKTAIAMFDAFIQCWDENSAAIPYARKRSSTSCSTQNGAPICKHHHFLNTPVAISTVSSAAAEALTSVYGDNLLYTDSSELEFGIPPLIYLIPPGRPKWKQLGNVTVLWWHTLSPFMYCEHGIW